MRWLFLFAIAVAATAGCTPVEGDTTATHDAVTSPSPSGKEDSVDGLPHEDIDTLPGQDGSDGTVRIDGTGDDGSSDGVVTDGSDAVDGAGCADFPPSGRYQDMENPSQGLQLTTAPLANGKCSGEISGDLFPRFTFIGEALPLGAVEKMMFGEKVVLDCQTPDHGELSIRVIDTDGNVDSEHFFVRTEE